MAISHIPGSIGHNFTPEYQISGVPYTRSGRIDENTVQDENNDPVITIVNNDSDQAQNIFILEFPKITQWLQFYAPAGINPKVYFSKKDAANKKNGITVSASEFTDVFRIRCVNIYFHNDDNAKDLGIIAGLTAINRTEFTEVIETFLENQ